MRIRFCVVRPAFLGAAATSRLRGAAALPAAAVCVATSRLICCSMFLNPFLAAFPPVCAPPGASRLAGTSFAVEKRAASPPKVRGCRRLVRRIKKHLSFEIKDRCCNLRCHLYWLCDAEPSHEHANTCSALNAGSRSRYSVGSASCTPRLPFPFPSAIHLPSSLLRESQLRPLSVSAHDGLTFASSVSRY